MPSLALPSLLASLYHRHGPTPAPPTNAIRQGRGGRFLLLLLGVLWPVDYAGVGYFTPTTSQSVSPYLSPRIRSGCAVRAFLHHPYGAGVKVSCRKRSGLIPFRGARGWPCHRAWTARPVIADSGNPLDSRYPSLPCLSTRPPPACIASLHLLGVRSQLSTPAG